MKNHFYSSINWILTVFTVVISSQHIMAKTKKLENFYVDQNNIRNVVTAKINDKDVVYISSLSDELSCYTIEGKKKWNYKLENQGIIFEIESFDVNNDGDDDLIAASGNGNIYCIDSSGKLLWNFKSNHRVRFSEIAVVKNHTNVQIFAGGNDYNLYELNTEGKLISTTKIKGVVRKLEAGNFIDKNQQDLFVMTYSHDKFRWEFMGILNSQTKKEINSLSYKKSKLKDLGKAMVTDIKISDIDKDGLADILFFGDVSFTPMFQAINGKFKDIAKFKANRKSSQRYGNSRGTCLLPVRDEIMFQFGGIMFKLNLKGKLIAQSGTRYGKNNEWAYSDFTLLQSKNALIAASDVEGGNGVYFYNLKSKNWYSKKHKQVGKITLVKNNLETLYNQVLNFKMPSYQTKSPEEWVMITSKEENSSVKKLKGGNIKYVIQKAPKENTDRTYLVNKIGESALKKDKRGKYVSSRADIVNMAKNYEKEGQPFTFWAGHGNDPFYIQIETLEQILAVAPNTCKGFVYAEMDNVDDPRVIHFVREYIPRLAKAIRKNNNAKLYFRYKNTFWALTNKLPLWQELFFSKKYSDILVPASEDTSSRTQDINLAGRVGMLCGGYINDFAMRLVDDNPTSWRPMSPGGQKSISPYLRQGVMMAAYGAKHGVIFNNNFTEEPGLNILFALMKSGVLPIVKKEKLLSIGSWHLIKDVNSHLIHSIDNHHSLKQYSEEDENAIFSLTQMHWAGTSLPSTDYSKLALGVNYRWLNYMPELPHGMVPIAPFEMANKLDANRIPYSVSNGEKGYLNNSFIEAKAYEDTFKEIVKKGEDKLHMVVKGAAWSAFKIDERHVRVVLIDPGYLEAKERDVKIIFNGRQPRIAKDILSNKNIRFTDTIKVKVPAGSLKFIDLTY